MGQGKTRRRKTPSRLRTVIAVNVATRAVVQFRDHPNIPMAIVEASGKAFSKSTVQRIMEAKVGTSLEQLDSLAKALDLMPYHLLLEDLDVKNPQVARGATFDEKEVYKISKAVAQEAVAAALSRTSPGVKASRKNRS